MTYVVLLRSGAYETAAIVRGVETPEDAIETAMRNTWLGRVPKGPDLGDVIEAWAWGVFDGDQRRVVAEIEVKLS